MYHGKATYQKLVLGILFYTAKFILQYFDKYESVDEVKFFHDVVDTVEKYLHGLLILFKR